MVSAGAVTAGVVTAAGVVVSAAGVVSGGVVLSRGRVVVSAGVVTGGVVMSWAGGVWAPSGASSTQATKQSKQINATNIIIKAFFILNSEISV